MTILVTETGAIDPVSVLAALEALPSAVRARRQELELSLPAAGKLLGIHWQTLARVERANICPNWHTTRLLLRWLAGYGEHECACLHLWKSHEKGCPNR